MLFRRRPAFVQIAVVSLLATAAACTDGNVSVNPPPPDTSEMSVNPAPEDTATDTDFDTDLDTDVTVNPAPGS